MTLSKRNILLIVNAVNFALVVVDVKDILVNIAADRIANMENDSIYFFNYALLNIYEFLF
jgi:hypothetical protein